MYFYAMITEVVQGVNVATTNSDIISLVIKPVPFVSVINQPSNEDVIINQKQNLPVLSVTATNYNENVNLNYQWYENSKNSTTDAVLIKGATNPSYLIKPDQVTTLGRKYFFVRISGLINGIKLLPVDSKVISLTTTSVPLISILTSPQNQTGIVHQTENLPTFSVEVNNIKMLYSPINGMKIL